MLLKFCLPTIFVVVNICVLSTLANDENFQMTCVDDKEEYCQTKFDGFRFIDGCNDCVCLAKGANCSSGPCKYHVTSVDEAFEYCEKVAAKNEKLYQMSLKNKNENVAEDKIKQKEENNKKHTDKKKIPHHYSENYKNKKHNRRHKNQKNKYKIRKGRNKSYVKEPRVHRRDYDNSQHYKKKLIKKYPNKEHGDVRKNKRPIHRNKMKRKLIRKLKKHRKYKKFRNRKRKTSHNYKYKKSHRRKYKRKHKYHKYIRRKSRKGSKNKSRKLGKQQQSDNRRSIVTLQKAVLQHHEDIKFLRKKIKQNLNVIKFLKRKLLKIMRYNGMLIILQKEVADLLINNRRLKLRVKNMKQYFKNKGSFKIHRKHKHKAHRLKKRFLKMFKSKSHRDAFLKRLEQIRKRKSKLSHAYENYIEQRSRSSA